MRKDCAIWLEANDSFRTYLYRDCDACDQDGGWIASDGFVIHVADYMDAERLAHALLRLATIIRLSRGAAR